MATLPERRLFGPIRADLTRQERQALVGSDRYPTIDNRFITETDISRQLDALLTNADGVLTDPEGNVLFG